MTRVKAILILVTLMGAAAPCMRAADKQDVIRKARASYYNATKRGLASFQCDVIPDWRQMLSESGGKDATVSESQVNTLSHIRYTVTVGPKGVTEFKHSTLETDNLKLAEAYQRIYSGMDLMLTGFFHTWVGFVFSPPFPEPDSKYDLQEAAGEYRLAYVEGKLQVATTFREDSSVTVLGVTNEQLSGTIRPTFQHASTGLLISGYQGDFKTAEHVGHLSMGIQYQEVDNFSLPRSLEFTGTQDSTHYSMKIQFDGCRAEKVTVPDPGADKR